VIVLAELALWAKVLAGAAALGLLVAGLHAAYNATFGRDRDQVSAWWSLVFAPLGALAMAGLLIAFAFYLFSNNS
jgi:hypothetical protein